MILVCLVTHSIIGLKLSEPQMKRNLRIYHECEGRIKESFLRITVWHHEACRVMTTGDPRDGFFYPKPSHE